MSYQSTLNMRPHQAEAAERTVRADTGKDPATGPPAASRLSAIARCCLTGGVPRRSLYVALVVGTALNLINNGSALFSGGPIDAPCVILDYVVPYCVATYGAVSLRLRIGRSVNRGLSARQDVQG